MNYNKIIARYKLFSSNLYDYAKNELELVYGPLDKTTGMDKVTVDNILELVNKFGEQGHSGFTASYTIGVLTRLLDYKPLIPLTGNDDEWSDVSGYTGIEKGQLLQNKRCFSVFKDNKGNTYDTNGKVFIDPDGSCYTNSDSRVFIEFPYIPKTEYIKVNNDGEVLSFSDNPGTYAAFSVHKETTNALRRWAKKNNIPNACEKPLHVTTVYSQKPIDYQPLGELDEHWISNPQSHRLQIFKDKEGKKCLVLTFYSDLLKNRWQEARRLKANWNHKEFTPHVTISYDCGDVNLSELPTPNIPIILTKEYTEDLQTKWAAK